MQSVARRFFAKTQQHELLYMLPFVVLSLCVNIGYLLSFKFAGRPFPTSDDSEWYLNYARSMLADFQLGLHMNDIMYLGYNMLLTALLGLFNDPAAVLYFQAIVAGVSVIFVYKIALLLFNRETAVVASLFYCLSPGLIRWTAYILTDSLFISLLLLCVYLLLRCFEHPRSNKVKLLFAAAALLMLVFRPAGVVTLAFILLYALIRMGRRPILDFIVKYRLAIGAGTAAAIAALLYAALTDKLAPLAASMQENALMVLYNIYATGWIYDKATPYDYSFTPDYTVQVMGSPIVSFIVNNWSHILALYGLRAVSFLGWWVWKHDVSSIVGIAKLVGHLVPVGLFAAGTVAAIAAKRFREASILWYAILAVFLFCIVFFIDVMYRYKAPALPFIAIIAAYGACTFVRRIARLMGKPRAK